MTDVEKAIEILRSLIFCGGCTTAADKEILSCNECDSFKAKQLALEALEKQMPKKPAFTCNNEVIYCPNCDYDMMGGIELDAEENPNYCWNCGQALDWREKNEI